MITPEVCARIDALKPWFHTIDCGNGIRIQRDEIHGGGDYPLDLWTRVRPALPESLAGLRVIDVGCDSGFFSVELKRLGAAYMLGLEPVALHLEQAKLVRQLSGTDIDLRPLSIYEVSEELGDFDISLCLGVLYHLRHPMLGLERLAAATRGLLVIESAVIADGAWKDGNYGGQPLSMVFVDYPPQPPAAEHFRNWFVPSRGCLEAWLRLLGFVVLNSSVVNDRALVVARRAQHAAGWRRVIAPQIEQRISEVPFWWHSIPLGAGIVTPGFNSTLIRV